MRPPESCFLVLVAISSVHSDSRMAEDEEMEISTRTPVVASRRCSLSHIRLVEFSVDTSLAVAVQLSLIGNLARHSM